MAFTIHPNISLLSSNLNLESTRRTTSTSLLELASLGPDEGLDTIVGVGVVDRGSLSKVRKGLTTGGSTQQDGVRSSGCPQGELIKGDALSSRGDDALAGILGEGKGAYAHLGAFEHTNIVGDLANDDGDLAVLVGHVLGETVEAERRGVDLRHVQTLGYGSTEFGVRSAGEEFVQLDEETVVGVLGLDDFHRRLVAATASSGFQVDSHVYLVCLK